MTAPHRSDQPDAGPAVIDLRDGSPLVEVLTALEVPTARPVVVVAGWGARELPVETRDAIDLFLRHVLLPVCVEARAVVVTGGTDAGVMAAVGAAAGDLCPSLDLVGVAPSAMLISHGAPVDRTDAARPEAHHRIIATPGNAWGDEGVYLVRAAERIAGGEPVVLVAIGGGTGTQREIHLAQARGWPVMLMVGHDGRSQQAADEMQLLWRPWARNEDGDRSRCFRGETAAVPLEARWAASRCLRWLLCGDGVLKAGWAQFATADERAAKEKRPTNVLAGGVLWLSLLAALAAIVSAWATGAHEGGGVLSARISESLPAASIVAKAFATGLPIVAGVLLVAIERRSRTGPWIDRRRTAEQTIGCLYRYRSKVPPFDAAPPDKPGKALAAALGEAAYASKGWAFVHVGRNRPEETPRPPHQLWRRIHPSDDLVGELTALVYEKARLRDQIRHLEEAAGRLNGEATRLAVGATVLAGGAAFSLALSWRWPMLATVAALFAAVVAATITWREFRQKDARADAMLQSASRLRAVHASWLSRPPKAREELSALMTLVGEAESAMDDEAADWQRGLNSAQTTFRQRAAGR